MNLKPLGRTQLMVTPIGLGLAALGRPGYINLGHADDLQQAYDVAAMEAHAHSVLGAAWAAGIRYFDAARSYGRAEQFLAGWLVSRAIPPDTVVVGSKWGYTYTADWQVSADKHEIKDHTLPVLRRQIAEIRSHLSRYLKLYQIHSATLDSGVLDDQAVLEELGALRDEGLVIGLSLSGPAQAATLRRAMAIEIGGQPLFRAVQATWNLLAREAGAALAEAHAAGMGVIVKEALANGRLTDRNEEPTFAPRRRLLAEVAAEVQVGLDGVALAAAMSQPWADVVLSGAARKDHLAANLQALAVRWRDTFDTRLAELAEPAEQYWQTRSELEWN